jgi:anaerobic ribonucleoside-triphosphate reductase activating protein
MRINAVIEESIVDGPGLRYALFTQGCPHRCPGCHNPQTHDAEGGYDISTDELIVSFKKSAADNPLLQGVTISGGEPFVQACGLIPFAACVKATGLDLWIYTGFTIEELSVLADPSVPALLSMADTLVDGRFDISQRTLESRFVGSSNQRIIKSPASFIPSPLIAPN